MLRVGDADDLPGLRTEVAALTLAADHGLPAPRLLAAELAGERPAVLVEQLAGTSAIPPERPPARLRALGRAAAALHRVELAPGPALPWQDRPIAVEDFAALRRRQPRPLLLAAEEQVAQRAAAPSAAAGVFVHGDLWQGNALWSEDTLAGLVDWDCAGAGAPGVDLGSLRCDAAICFGAEAADDICAGWEEAAGRPPPRSPTGTWWPPSAPRRTWAGSRGRSPGRAGPTSPASSWSGGATTSCGPPSTWTPRPAEPGGPVEQAGDGGLVGRLLGRGGRGPASASSTVVGGRARSSLRDGPGRHRWPRPGRPGRPPRPRWWWGRAG